MSTMMLASFTTSLVIILIGFPPKTDALIPYNNKPTLWDMMMLPPEADPFKILEQTPLNSLDTVNLLARADWKETATHHVISLDVPGMKREDIKIEVEEIRVLKVSGERKPEEGGDKWHVAERTSGKFWRQFKLPVDAEMEKITAKLEDGVLKIKVPKRAGEEKKQSRVIDIAGGGQGISSNGEDIKATQTAATCAAA